MSQFIVKPNGERKLQSKESAVPTGASNLVTFTFGFFFDDEDRTLEFLIEGTDKKILQMILFC